MRIGICCHGYTFRENGNYEQVVWGVPKQDLMGKIPTAVWAMLTFHTNHVEALVLGTGPLYDGKRESEIEYAMLRNRISRLQEFSGLAPLLPAEKLLKLVLERVYVLIDPASTTRQEIVLAKKVFNERGIDFAVHISSPDHAPRVLKECALTYHDRDGQPTGSVKRFCVIPSQVPYTQDGTKGVVVAEPTKGGRDYLRRIAATLTKE